MLLLVDLKLVCLVMVLVLLLLQDVPATDATTITAISLMVGAAKSDLEVMKRVPD
jgi:hypothetical protein